MKCSPLYVAALLLACGGKTPSTPPPPTTPVPTPTPAPVTPPKTPTSLADVGLDATAPDRSTYGRFVELIERNEAAKLAGGNLLRVLGRAEEVAARLQQGRSR